MDKKIKKVVYTVLLGDYKLNEPVYINKDWSLICFTDQKIISKNWSIIHVKPDGNPRRKAREIKIRCDKFLDFDICLYLDSQFIIKCDIDDFINKNIKNNFTLMKHKIRKCLYKEAKCCIRVNKGNKSIILEQIKQYKKEGFPSNFGLYATGILIRKNTSDVIRFMKLWHDEIRKYSCRDQISFPYILRKNPIKVDALNFENTCNLFRK